MDIFALRKNVFNDLKNPLSYLTNRGFVKGLVPDSARVWGNTAYFFSNGQDWHTMSDEIQISSANVNTFTSDEHTCKFKTGEEWSRNATSQLRACAEMVYEQKLLPIASDNYSTFDSFWKACTCPTKNISLMDYAYSRRGHKKQFINIYNSTGEITGAQTLTKDSIVQIPIRWTFVVRQDIDQVTFRFRPGFCNGIQVKQLGGPGPIIKRDWDWTPIDFKSISVPMYSSFRVKTPALKVLQTFGNTFKVDLDSKPVFKNAMDAFHTSAGCSTWDGTIHLKTSKIVSSGSFVLAKISCDRNKDHINWYTEDFFVVRRPNLQNLSPRFGDPCRAEEKEAKTGGKKRDADNMDSFPGVKTKRQCIQDDIDGHKKE
jgi:hypothetical protein